MKKVTIGAIALTAGLLLTGCGDDRENVAKDYVMALSDADIKEAKSLSDGKTLDRLDFYEEQCSEKEIDSTIKSYYRSYKSEEFRSAEKGLSKDKKSEIDKIVKEAEEKIEAIKKAKYKEEEEEAKLYELIKEANEVLFDKLGIKVAPYMMDIMAWDRAGKTTRDSIKKVRETYSEEITRICYASQAFGNIVETINTLEMKEISPDKAEVRLELIDQDEASHKITINVEKIKGDWKVIDSKRD